MIGPSRPSQGLFVLAHQNDSSQALAFPSFSPLRLQLAQARRDVRKHPDFKEGGWVTADTADPKCCLEDDLTRFDQ